MSKVAKLLTFGLIGDPKVASIVQPIAALAAPFFPPAAILAAAASLSLSLQAKPPPARGSASQLVIAPEAPMPYVMGEGYVGGVLRYQRSYGATLDKVPNPYRFMAVVYTGGGPVESISPRVDFAAVGSYYSGFLYTGTKLGACPDTALTPQWSGAPGWSTSSKLSGKACIGWSLKFDKNGKVFASGMPQLGAYGQWVKVYDPRLDSTRAGGSGSHRVDDEAAWAWSANPALHAASYGYGRYQNDSLSGGARRVLGVGLPDDAIDWANVAAWANVCDANGWELFGVLYEPGDRWANLRDICAAGGAEPLLTSGKLSFHYDAPRVALDTITAADLVHDAEQGVTAMASWRDRLNTIVPRRISEAHNWQPVQDEAVSVSSYVTEDGEVKQAEWPFNFVKDKDQAAQLARYRLENSRELAIELTCTHRLAAIRPGDCLQLDLMDELGLEGKAVVLRREVDPATFSVRLSLISETSGKHAFALGQTGTAPATPALGQTAEQRDALIWEASNGTPVAHSIVSASADYPIYATSSTQIAVNANTVVIDDGRSFTFSSTTISSLTASTVYGVFYDIVAGTFAAVAHPAATQMANPGLVFLGWQATPDGGGTYPTPSTAPDGFGGTIGGSWAEYNVILP